VSAVVADGMIGSNHRPDTELIAQGMANICSSIFGGIPATGAIARTATNVKNGGRTPVAGMVHAVTLLLILLFVGKWAALIPMATLAGILVLVAYNMSEWKSFVAVLKGPKNDRIILMTTFILTVLVDLTVAIEAGMLLAACLFLQKMIKFSNVSIWTKDTDQGGRTKDSYTKDNSAIPHGVEVFEIAGPLFFGAAYKFKEAMQLIEQPPLILIIRMRQVPVIDATGIRTLEEVYKASKKNGTKLVLSEVHDVQVRKELQAARLLFAIGKGNVTESFEAALSRSRVLLQDMQDRKKINCTTLLVKNFV
jgi:sulfate permease, SulP family